MRTRFAGLRLGVVLLFMMGLLSPFAATGVGAQDLTCDDFNSQRAAQAVLEADPSLADALDPDGDGEACNEDEPADDPTEEPTDEPAGDPTDEPAGDAEAYLADIQAEVDDLQEQVDRFLELDALGADATQDDVDEINDIAAGWVEYPDVAAEFVAPEGLEDVEDAYLDVADSFGTAGELWEEFWAIPSGDPEEDAALEAFNDEFISAQDQLIALNDLIAEAGESTGPSDDPTEEPTDGPTDEPSGDAEAYLSDIQAEVDSVVESFDRLVEIDSTFTDASSTEQAEMVTELEELAASWAEYPDVAAEFEAPPGLEDVEDAYLDFADLVGETGETWLIWWDIPQDDPEEDPAFDDFTETFDAAYAAADDVTAAIEDAGGATEPADDPTEDPTEEPLAAGDAYVADVQAEIDDLQEQVDRFDEIQAEAASGDLTDAEAAALVDEVNDIAAGWVEYPDVAAEFEAPDGTVGFEDIESAYFNLADTVGEAGELWEEYWAIPVDDPDEAAAEEAFFSAYADVQDGIDEVQDLLDEAGGPSDDPTEEPSDDPTEEPTDDPTDEPSGDADEYLATVSDTAADWQDSIDRFSEIIGLGAEATDADNEELAEILITWASAPDVAAEVEAPAGFEDIQAAYEDFADELAAASTAIADYLAADPDSPEADAAFDDLLTAIENAEEISAELDDLLADAGA